MIQHYFHTIKSILNSDYVIDYHINQMNFHTIKSILNLIVRRTPE